MPRRLLLAVSRLCGVLIAISTVEQLSAATSSTIDIVPAESPMSPDTVNVSGVKTMVRPRTDPGQVAPSGNPLWSVALSVLTATQARPIFLASRRPPRPTAVIPVAAPVAPPPPPPPVDDRLKLALIGAVVGDDDAIAILVDSSNQRVLRLRAGETHNGWQLSSIRGREVVFKKDSRSEALMIQRQAGMASTPGDMTVPTAVAGPNMPALQAPTNPSIVTMPLLPRRTQKNDKPDGL